MWKDGAASPRNVPITFVRVPSMQVFPFFTVAALHSVPAAMRSPKRTFTPGGSYHSVGNAADTSSTTFAAFS